MSNPTNVVAFQRQRAEPPPAQMDLDAEAAVIAAILREAETLELVLGELRPEHFYSESNRRIYEAALDLATNSKPIDAVTVAGWLRDHERFEQVGGAKYLGSLVDKVPAISRIETYARRIVEKWQLRAVRDKAIAIAAAVPSYVGDVRAFLNAAEVAMRELAADGAIDTMTDSSEAYRRKRIAIDDVRRGTTPSGGIATGFADVDRFTGGIEPGTLTIIAAPPGIGKTAFALQIATNIAASWVGCVPFFSLEMLTSELVDRQLSQWTRIDHERVRRPDLWTAHQETEIDDAWRTLSGLPIWWDEESALPVDIIRARARRVAKEAERKWKFDDGSKLKPAVVFVDHLGKMGASPGMQDRKRYEIVAHNVEQLKIFAKHTKIPVIALAQLTGESEKQNRRPKLSDLAETKAIEREADRVWFLYRPKRSDEIGEAELIIAKARGGREGTIELHWNGPSVRFDNAHQPKMF